MNKDEKDHGDGKTLKVTDAYLEQFAKVQLQALVTELQSSPVVQAVRAFAAGGDGTGVTSVTGVYNKLMPGAIPEGKTLRSDFVAYCKSIDDELGALEKQVTTMQTKLENVRGILAKGEEDALNAADMLKIVDQVTGGLGGGSAPVPPKK